MNMPQSSAISRLFSSAVFKEMARKGASPLFARLCAQTDIPCARDSMRVADVFEQAFDRLKAVGQRDEYVYKAALTHKVLLGTHSLSSASMLTEFRAGTCKADLVILNGTASVYEIKSERDTLSRLDRQLSEYRKVFAKVSVIASEEHVDGVMRLAPLDVGVLCLSRRYQISTVRAAVEDASRVCPSTLFDSLRSAEAAEVLKRLGVDAPNVPNSQLFAEQKRLFSELDPSSVHREAVRALKRSRNLAPLATLVDDLPQSLHAAALTTAIRRGDHARLKEAVNTPMDRALQWGSQHHVSPLLSRQTV